MSDVETKPECDVKEPDNEEIKAESVETTATDTASQELPAEAKESDNKGTVLDVFKKYAGGGANWADLMLAETLEQEKKELERRRTAIQKEIAGFNKPYIVYVSNLSQCVTAEEIYYHFGGSASVSDVYRYNEGSTGEALVEFHERDHLFDALMLNDEELFKSKLKIEYVDPLQQKCRTIPAPPGSKPPPSHNTQHQPSGRGKYQQYPSNNGRKQHNNRGSTFNKPYDNRQNTRQPQKNFQSNDVRYTQKSSSQQEHQSHKPSSFEPKPQASVDAPPKPPQPRVEKPSPFGQAKAKDTIGQKMIETEKKILEEKRVQKKMSISSQVAADEPPVTEEQKAEPIAEESKSTENVEPEKKQHSNIAVVTNSKRKTQQQHQGHRPNRIDSKALSKYLPVSSSSPATSARDNKGKQQKTSETDSQHTCGPTAVTDNSEATPSSNKSKKAKNKAKKKPSNAVPVPIGKFGVLDEMKE